MKQTIRNVCDKYGSSVKKSVSTTQFIFDPEHNLIFCGNSKVVTDKSGKWKIWKWKMILPPPFKFGKLYFSLSHHANKNKPSCQYTTMPISHYAYQPLCLSAIMPICNHKYSFKIQSIVRLAPQLGGHNFCWFPQNIITCMRMETSLHLNNYMRKYQNY